MMGGSRHFACSIAFIVGVGLLAAIVSGCAGAATRQDAKLLVGEWAVASLRNGAVLAPVASSADAPTATFASTTLTGSGGVNSYAAEYRATDGDSITITVGPVTKKAGPPSLMTQENAYLSALADARRYWVTSDELQLLDSSGSPIVSFRHAVPVALENNQWTCENYNNGREAVVSLVGSSTITIRFGNDGRLSGSSGVNQYATSYTTNGTTMQVDTLMATTRISGPPRLLAQEKAYLRALQQTQRFQIAGDELVLQSNTLGRVATFALAKP
jgi:putative lipoprotein